MEIRVHGPGPGARAARGHHAHARATTSSSRSASACTEGLLRSADDLDTVAYCLAGEGEQEYNVVTVKLRHPVDRDAATSGSFVANASCGLCGKTTLDEVEQHCAPVGRRARSSPVR